MTQTEEKSERAVRALPPRRRSPAKLLAWSGGAALLAAAVAAAAIGFGGGTGTATATRTPPATATVTRTTLTETETVDGTLGYGDPVTVTGRSQGTITWLPGEGSVITRGHGVYSVDADRRPLLYGTMPLYRTLRDGVEGKDVELLERNLDELGYTGFDVDDEFTWATREAVEDWQEDLGLDVTGEVRPGDVVVADGRIHVADLKKALGDSATGPVLTATGTTREVLVNLDVADEHLVKKGMKAIVELPDGSTVDGKVTSVGKVATAAESATTVEVKVSVSGLKKSYDAAPVEVTIVAERRENVLVVPVGALVALAEGGYGVQVVEGGAGSHATRYVAVETGMFADGKVEVTGGVTDGMTVAVPK